MTWILLIALAVLVVAVIVVYNQLVQLRVRTENAWADIDVQLKRRHDLIPNLVETVKGYVEHERETLESVVAARTRAVEAESPAEQAEAENMLTGALRQLFALAEDYPELRAVESFTDLQESLEEIEEAIQNARRYYNAVVRDFNTRIQQFPVNLVARAFDFSEREFFELAAPEEREAPEVDFGSTRGPRGAGSEGEGA
jgi:LemA protein